MAGYGNKMEFSVHVDNLPWSTTNNQLKRLFSSAGHVSDVRSPPTQPYRDNIPYESNRRYAFVRYRSEKEQEMAINMFNERLLNGEPMKCTKSSQKPEYKHKQQSTMWSAIGKMNLLGKREASTSNEEAKVSKANPTVVAEVAAFLDNAPKSRDVVVKSPNDNSWLELQAQDCQFHEENDLQSNAAVQEQEKCDLSKRKQGAMIANKLMNTRKTMITSTEHRKGDSEVDAKKSLEMVHYGDNEPSDAPKSSDTAVKSSNDDSCLKLLLEENDLQEKCDLSKRKRGAMITNRLMNTRETMIANTEHREDDSKGDGQDESGNAQKSHDAAMKSSNDNNDEKSAQVQLPQDRNCYNNEDEDESVSNVEASTSNEEAKVSKANSTVVAEVAAFLDSAPKSRDVVVKSPNDNSWLELQTQDYQFLEKNDLQPNAAVQERKECDLSKRKRGAMITNRLMNTRKTMITSTEHRKDDCKGEAKKPLEMVHSDDNEPSDAPKSSDTAVKSSNDNLKLQTQNHQLLEENNKQPDATVQEPEKYDLSKRKQGTLKSNRTINTCELMKARTPKTVDMAHYISDSQSKQIQKDRNCYDDKDEDKSENDEETFGELLNRLFKLPKSHAMEKLKELLK